MNVTAASLTFAWSYASFRNRIFSASVRTAMKRQFCRLKAVGANVAREISSPIRSSVMPREASKMFVELRCLIASMIALFIFNYLNGK